MAIITSRKVSFVLKLIALLPLTFAMLTVAGIATVGGHGNYLPLILILGPANILFSLDWGPGGEVILSCLILCLYVAYALLLKFAKASVTVYWIFGLHIASSVIAMFALASGDTLLLGSTIGAKGARGILDGLFMLGIVLVLFSLVIWTLVSIWKSNGGYAVGKINSSVNDDPRAETKTEKTKFGKLSIGCFVVALAAAVLAAISGGHGYGTNFLLQVILHAVCVWLSLSGVVVSLLGIVQKEPPKTFCIFGFVLNGLALALAAGCWLGIY